MADNSDEEIKIRFDSNADEAADKSNKLAKSLDNVTDSAKGQQKAGKSVSEGLEDMGGAVGNTITAMKGMLKQMWLIVANPLVLVVIAIVGALTLLFKAFTSTKGGGEQLERIMAGISATLDILRDRFLKVASAIWKFMKGDFKGAMQEGKEAVAGLGDEMQKEFNAAMKYKKGLQEVADATRELGVSRKKLNRDISESERILTDVNATYAQKQKALKAVEEAEGKQTSAELANAKKKLASLKGLANQSDSSSEALQELADAQGAVYELEQKSSEDRRKVADFNKTLNAEESARLKTIADERNAAYKEKLAKQKEAQKLEAEALKKHNDEIAALLKERLDAEKELIRFNQDLNDKTDEEKLQRQKDRALEEIEALKQKGIDVAGILALNEEKYFTLEFELRQKRAEEKAIKDKEIYDKESEEKDKQAAEDIERDKILFEQKEAIEDAKLNLAQRGIALLSGLFGKSKAAQKAALLASNAVGLAEVVINTQRAVSADIAVPFGAGLPKVPIDIASGALGAASIVAATAKGLKDLGGGSGGSPSSMGGLSSGGSAPPSVQFNNSAENQIGQSISKSQGEQPPIKVVVAESDISEAQNNVKVLVEKNSF